jgi:hypothetical protein
VECISRSIFGAIGLIHYLYHFVIIIVVKNKLKIIREMSRWMTFKYIDLRLYTMYGTKYKSYILSHPLLFIRDINRYIEWCIMMDKHR